MVGMGLDTHYRHLRHLTQSCTDYCIYDASNESMALNMGNVKDAEFQSNEAIQIAATLARRFEGGPYSRPYLCPANVPTIGYGATRYEDGVRVSLNDPPITARRAEELLQWELSKVLLSVNKYCPGQPTNVQAALIDFTFNLGSGRLAASTLRKRINAGDYAGSQVELMRWTKANGKVLNGLVKRRAAECLLLA